MSMFTTIHHPYQLNLNNNLYLVFGVKVKAIVHARTRRCGWLWRPWLVINLLTVAHSSTIEQSLLLAN